MPQTACNYGLPEAATQALPFGFMMYLIVKKDYMQVWQQ